MFAHVTAGTVDAVGQPPLLVEQDGRWWDLRDRDLTTLALVGWFPVTEATKPADTALTTWSPVFSPNGGVVVESWVEVAKRQEQLDAEAAATTQRTIEDALAAALATLQLIIDDTNANINSNPATRIKDLARAERRIIRLLIRRFDGTA